MMNIAFGANGDGCLRVLCLGAHADDLEIGCGGTLMTLLRSNQNVCVKWIVFSALDERAAEARNSAGRFLEGAATADIHVESFHDGFFPYDGSGIKQYFEELKRGYLPDLILTHYRDDRHQDHRLVSDLTWNTFRHHLILEYEIPKYDGDFGSPNTFVPLDEDTCRRKAQSIMELFGTQRDRHWFTEETFLAVARLRGIEAAAPTGYAEGFFCRKAVVDLRPHPHPTR
jgi:LmbE family N-acetylglucosaminyl deacetylase